MKTTYMPMINTIENIESKVEQLLSKMTVREKLGQMSQMTGSDQGITEELKQAIVKGEVGSVINEIHPENLVELQRLAREESRLGIPLIIGRDVIHGYHTIFPIPLAQAASWNPELIEAAARIAAIEASAVGIHWTFAPMIDITRDPRWGRIAESLGEDPYLTGELGKAMVRGFQGHDLTHPQSIAACAKHFAGYGYSESGKDYAYVNISENELRNIVLPPFKACAEIGAATFMAAFSDLNGVPATGNEFLMKQILREEWAYDGMMVSDWDSVLQLIEHGFVADEKEAAYEAIQAGIDMEMVSTTFLDKGEELLNENRISIEQIDACVRNILRLKFNLGLFEQAIKLDSSIGQKKNNKHLEICKKSAIESCVLLKNSNDTLPISINNVNDIAVIGPLANEAVEQLGTWIFDAKSEWSVTPLEAIKYMCAGKANVHYAQGLSNSRSKSKNGFRDAFEAAKQSDVVLLFMGEESILSGEAHCRAVLNLPGYQNELVEEIAKIGKPIVLVILAGRPLTIESPAGQVDSVLYAWHPGTMAGPAIADLLFGIECPSGKLPVTFPKAVGQIPIYYNQRNSGRPGNSENYLHIDKIPQGAEQTSLGNASFHLDAGFTPLYPFGYGLSYTKFKYDGIQLSKSAIKLGEHIEVSTMLSNTGNYEASEVVQLYIRDLVGNVTRPIKELKAFKKIKLKSGESKKISFTLHTDDLSFYNRKMQLVTEPGEFHIWIGGDSNTTLRTSFTIQ